MAIAIKSLVMPVTRIIGLQIDLLVYFTSSRIGEYTQRLLTGGYSTGSGSDNWFWEIKSRQIGVKGSLLTAGSVANVIPEYDLRLKVYPKIDNMIVAYWEQISDTVGIYTGVRVCVGLDRDNFMTLHNTHYPLSSDRKVIKIHYRKGFTHYRKVTTIGKVE